MFVVLFIVSLVLAFAVAAAAAWASKEPIERILYRFVAPDICAAISKYLTLAIVVAGVSMGTRVRALEEYNSAPSWNKAALTASLTQEFWLIELYRTIVATVEGILWLLLLFSFFVLIALVIIRKAELKQLQSAEGQAQPRDSENHVRMMR